MDYRQRGEAFVRCLGAVAASWVLVVSLVVLAATGQL
jgi:hypothetical protein